VPGKEKKKGEEKKGREKRKMEFLKIKIDGRKIEK
jgi:hypothetical protein